MPFVPGEINLHGNKRRRQTGVYESVSHRNDEKYMNFEV